jgi:hypothetical protein
MIPCCCESDLIFIITYGDCGAFLRDNGRCTVTSEDGSWSDSCIVCSDSIIKSDGTRCTGGWPQSRCIIKVPQPGIYKFSCSGGDANRYQEAGGSCSWTDRMPAPPPGSSGQIIGTGCCQGGDHPMRVCVTPVGCAAYDFLSPHTYPPLSVTIDGGDAHWVSATPGRDDVIGAWCGCVSNWRTIPGYVVTATDSSGRFADFSQTVDLNTNFAYDCENIGTPGGTSINDYNWIQMQPAGGYQCLCSFTPVDAQERIIRFGCNVPAKTTLKLSSTCGNVVPELIWNNPATAGIPRHTNAGWTALDTGQIFDGLGGLMDIHRFWQFPAPVFGLDACSYLYLQWSLDPSFPTRPVTYWNNGALFPGHTTFAEPQNGGYGRWLKCPPGFLAYFEGMCIDDRCGLPGWDGQGCVLLDQDLNNLPFVLTLSE